MDRCLLEIIVCPICNEKFYLSQNQQELICKTDKLAFPIRNRIPVLLESEARILSSGEIQS